MVYNWSWVENDINYILTFWYYPALIILFDSDIAAKIFKSKSIGTFGKMTYDIYLWHNPGYLMLYILIERTGWGLDLNRRRTMLAYAIVSCLVGAFSYHFVDKPIAEKITRKIRSFT